ncbi:unnamed protein product, partial [Rotaria sp. Silwood1]
MQPKSLEFSDLYIACRDGDFYLVEGLLASMSVEQINSIEFDGSTPLHIASSNGHARIVELLLNTEVVSRSFRNQYNLTAYDEAQSEEIRRLFKRKNGAARFCDGMQDQGIQIEWMKADPSVQQVVAWELKNHKWPWHKKPGLDEWVNCIRQKYLDGSLKDMKGIGLIRFFYQNAQATNDPVQLIRAYTAETQYYKILNERLAQLHELHESDNWWGHQDLLDIMLSHPSLDRFTYIGTTYRGMRIMQHDLKLYSVGTSLMNKAFLSTSKDRAVAEAFGDSCGIQDGKFSAICT